jgi:hypothetical protein
MREADDVPLRLRAFRPSLRRIARPHNSMMSAAAEHIPIRHPRSPSARSWGRAGSIEQSVFDTVQDAH